MQLKAQTSHMETCKELFKEDKEYALFSKALVHFMNEHEFFEKYVHNENPFKGHFHTRFQEAVEKEEDCFALHEDMVLFFREKALRLGIHNIEDIEREVLEDFEARPHTADSLVATWYFEKLPLLVYQDIADTIKSSKKAHNAWLEKE